MESGALTDSLRETVECFDSSGPPLTTPEVADSLDLGRRTAYARLDRLADRGRLETKKVGANARVWWRSPQQGGDDQSVEPSADDAAGAGPLGGAQPVVQSLLDSQPDLFYAFDTEGTFLRWNDRLPAVTGYTDAEIEAMHPVDFVADEAAERTVAAMERVLEDGETVTIELPLVTADGTELPYEFTGGPIRDETGEIVGFTGIGRDVSDRKARQRWLEREHDDLQASVNDVVTRIDEAFVALDDDWRFTYANDRAADLLERSVGELVGTEPWDVLPDALTDTVRESLEAAMETGEAVEFEFYSEPLDAFLELRGYPAESGMSVYFRDVTERRERERDLELYETIFETVEDGVYVLDDEFRFDAVNDAYVEMTGYDREELLGSHCSLVVDDSVVEESFERMQALVDGEDGSAVLQADIHRADDTVLPAESRFTALPTEDGSSRKVGIVRDVSDRVARERELERYERMVETADDGIYVLDGESRFVAVNSALCSLTGYEREELIGEPATLVTGDANVVAGERIPTALDAGEDAEAVRSGEKAVPGDEGAMSGIEEAMSDDEGAVPSEQRTVEETITTKDGETIPIENRLAPFDVDGDSGGCIGVLRDISDRMERDHELRTRIRQQEVVSELGQRALADRDLDSLLADAAAIVADTLDNEYCKVLDLLPDDEELLLRQGVGWDDGIVGNATVSAVEADSQAAYTLVTEEPVVVADLETEERFSGPDLLTDHDVRSGISTIVGSPEDPWGILGTHDVETAEFSEHDAAFVQSVANILASAIERHHRERELVNQRERITALNNVNEVVRGITGAVIEQSTREEIEATVCERLAETDSYQFAWIGDVDSDSRTVNLRAEAGVDGYLEDVAISVDPDDEHSQGPTGTAFITGSVQTSRDAGTESPFGPWQDAVAAYEYRSSAAVPIVHDDATYGVLNVYADRTHAFEGEEREVVAQLGEIVGHAIAATERKRALLADEVVELEYWIEDVFDSLGIEVDGEGPIRLDETVPIEDGDFLLFGHATADQVETVERLVDGIPFFDDVTFRGDGEERRFELRASEPPILSKIASTGGAVDEAVIEDGDYRLRVHLPPSGDVRALTESMAEIYPSATLLRREQITRERREVDSTLRNLGAALTDRQRTVLEAAYHAGFFGWPREASGEDVAESIGIAPATFHQHLRKAEEKVYDLLFATGGDSGG